MRDRLRQDLQVGLGHGDGKAQQEADAEDQWQVFRFGQRGADLRADGRHGLLRAQGEQAHAEDQHQRADEKRQKQLRLHGRQKQAEQAD